MLYLTYKSLNKKNLFLFPPGVNSVKAGKFRKMEVSDTVVDKQDTERYDITTDTEQTDDTEEKTGETNE